MTGATFLQLFLLLNIFLMGALAVIAIQHAYAHFRPHPHKDDHPAARPTAQLPQAVKRRLLRKAEDSYQTILDRSASELQHSLQATTLQLTKQLDKFGSQIVHDEAERYRLTLQQLTQQAADGSGGAQSEIAKHQESLEAKLDERQQELETGLEDYYKQQVADMKLRLATQEDQLRQQMDTKLADAVTSFLLETLQHEVDLGAQTGYLTAMLNEHKDELAKKVSNEA